MKKLLLFMLAAVMILAFTACADDANVSAPENSAATSVAEKTVSNGTSETDSSAVTETTESTAETSAAPASEPVSEHKSVLVVVFSATGTTKGVAEKIAAIENADLYEIKAAREYTAADLNWNDRNSRSTKEQNDKSARPEIGSKRISLEGYEKIYVGFPIWWGEEPRIMDTFVESYDFTGITLIPFCTSGGSGIGRSGPNMEALAGTGTWLNGARHNGSISEAELQAWIDGLK